ncbi:TlpA disulfide reductase family protein [Evansella sp. AB-P1]|uniref:TlpA disulfide reductase family protein n=1 Tax=Evansella sp. AB-P1 TaxID=3037653 RepID=UPI00241C0EE0|nr:TlpA disulfide reductase family protein [Evansella sp. AB-P1]MDG5789142.1 TlpA disulfide reductase family protein [Evansella sp. AB-P1]
MWKHRLQWGVLCLVLFISGAFYLQSDHEFALTQRTMSEVSEGIQQNEKATPFSLKTMDGEIIHLQDFTDEKVFLFFFTTWCHICAQQWEQLEIAQKEGILDDTKVIAINLTKAERSKRDILSYAESLPISDDLVILLDSEGEVQDLYQVYGIPTGLFIDKDGVIDKRFHELVTVEKMIEEDFFTR